MSRNYLHYARSLLASVKEFCPDADLVVGLCDRKGDTDFSNDIFDVIELEELDIRDRHKFIFRYTILEINTAIKPYVIGKLFDAGYQKVIYFDPDICVYSSLQEMLSLLDTHQMLLTPHLSNLLDDGNLPDELTILKSGSYNLGYIGLRNTTEMNKFVVWWQAKLYSDCVVDLAQGLFVDQKWMDLVPGMFEGVYVNRDESWNVAYWNLNHRELVEKGSGFEVNGKPLTFFHFSGFSTADKTLSKHQNRFSRLSAGKAVSSLCEEYSQRLDSNGLADVINIPYHFNFFPDGTPIPDFARRIYREDYDWVSCKHNMLTREGAANFMGYLNEPIRINGRKLPWITRLALKLYQGRIDLQEAYPDLSGPSGRKYADWFIRNAEDEAKFARCFVQPIEAELGYTKEGSAVGPSENEPSALGRSFSQKFYILLYRFAWRFRHLARPFLSVEFRHQSHVKLIEKVPNFELQTHQPEPDVTGPDPRAPDSPPAFGINVFGYTCAESGIGQSIRSSIRGLVANDVPVAVSDYEDGNLSRMNDSIDDQLFAEPVYGLNLFHINADEIIRARERIGADQFEGHYNIGYWAWELPEFPDRWLDALNVLDEVWVPSNFCQKAIAEKATIPVLVMPHCVDEPDINPTFTRRYFSIPQDEIIFLTMFDALSIPERKNPLAVISAFTKMIDKITQPCKLVIKVANLDKTSEFKADLLQAISDREDVIIIDRYFARDEVYGLLSVVDSLVSLHRSEGFGLAIAEAMALGIPVIATGWSGNTDFMNSFNSLPVSYHLQTLDKDYGPYEEGSYWAEPDLDSAIQAMMLVASRSELVEQIALRAKKTIGETNSPGVTGRLMASRIRFLHRRLQGTSESADVHDIK